MTRLPLLVVLSLAAVAEVSGQLRLPLLGVGLTADPFFDDSLVHEIRLTINDRDWQALKESFRENTYYPADFQWGSEIVRNVGIRSRGNISRSPTKPGLRVDFNRYSDGQRFRGLTSVVLRNHTTDPSYLHERLSMLLLQRMGVPASREAHARLYVNSEYAGLYSIVESVDKAFLRQNFREDGGYLFNYQYQEPYYLEHLGPNPAEYVPLPFEPETHETDPKPEAVERLIFTINETSDAEFRASIGTYVDLEAFIRLVAVEAFLADDDSLIGTPSLGVNNFYLYRFVNTSRFMFLPWDKSEAFGSVVQSVFQNITDVPPSMRNRLIARALTFPDLYNFYLDMLLECVRLASEPPDGADGPGWLAREIEREYEQIRESALADTAKPFSNDEFEYEIGVIRRFAEQRGAIVASEVAASRPKAGLTLRYRHWAAPMSRKD
jgi:hypothetical protein